MLQLTIHQTDIEPLNRFKKAVNLGKVNGPYPTKGENWRSIYNYTVYNKKAEIVFTLIEPFLCAIKHEQGVDAIFYYNKNLEKAHPPYIHGTRRMYITKKCRCELCCTANRDYMREYKLRPGP